MRDLLVTAIVFLTIPYILQRPYIGVLVWSWIGYMNPHRLTFGFAFNFPFAQIIAIVALVSVLLSKDEKKVPVTPVTITLLIFVIIMILSTIFALSPELAREELIRSVKIQLIIFLTLMLMTTRDRIEKLLWVIVGSIGFFGIKGGVFTLLTGGSGRIWGPSGSFIAGNNEIGLAMLIILPLAYYLRGTLTNIWGKRLMLLGMILCLISVISTYSRGAFIGMIAMLIFFWWKRSQKIWTAVIVSILLALSLNFMPEQYFDRISSIQNYEEDSSAMGRINAWAVAINIASDRIFAGGFRHWSLETFDRYAPIADDVHDAHSIYFEVLGELGYPGLFVFLLLHFLTWMDASWIIKNAANYDQFAWCNDLARMVQVALIAYYTGGAFLGLAYWDLPYHLIAIVVLIKQIMKNELNILETQLSTHNKKKWPWEK